MEYGWMESWLGGDMHGSIDDGTWIEEQLELEAAITAGGVNFVHSVGDELPALPEQRDAIPEAVTLGGGGRRWHQHPLHSVHVAAQNLGCELILQIRE
jgi:hypothetical protein